MYQINLLPLSFEIETKEVLKKTTTASRALAELKSIAKTIPNTAILTNTLVLQESKDSSEIENIITTHDELFKADIFENMVTSMATKEVQRYAQALMSGFGIVKNTQLLTANNIISLQEILERNSAGFRKQAGTNLKNAQTGQVIYTPPQDYDTISDLMTNLVRFINDDELSDIDPLVKMAIIHVQFESIHPFYDGNGRTGRIINILYLILQGLLDMPILYLSRFITQNKQAYYQNLRNVRDKNDWQTWVLFMLDAVEKTAKETIKLIENIKILMQEYKIKLKENYSFYSQELLNNLFKHPYTKIEFVQKDLGIKRLTATKYLNALVKDGLLEKIKIGKSNFYVNNSLCDLLVNKTLV